MTANISIVPTVRFAHDIAAIAHESQELTNILQKIVQNAGALLDVPHSSLALIDASGSTLITVAALLPHGQQPRHTRFRFNEGVAGWVAEHRQSLLLNQAERDPRFKRLGRHAVGSMLCVPLLDRQQLLGTLTVSSEQSDCFDEQMQHRLEILADQAVQTIGQARLAAIAQRQSNQLEMLFRLARGITARLDPETLYHTLLMYTQRMAPCGQAVIYLIQEGRQELMPVAELAEELVLAEDDRDDRYIHTVRTTQLHSEPISLCHEESLPVWATQHRHAMVRAGVPLMQRSERAEMAEIAVPLISKNVLYGVLWLTRAASFSSDEFRQVRHLSTMAAATLENMALFQEVCSEQEELSAILASSSEGIATLDLNARFLKVNTAFGRLFDLAPEQIIGMECLELFASHEVAGVDHKRDLALIYQALQRREALPYMEIDLHMQDAARSIGLSITPVTTTETPFSLLVARDVTAMREMTRMKANFLSTVAHELRSPINAINGYLDLTLEGIAGELSEQQHEFIQRARAGSEHLYALVEDLLLVTRTDAGQLHLNRALIRLPEVIENAVEEMELTARDNGITIEVEIAPELPRLYADAIRLQQVLRNLLSNALRFTAKGGHVTVSAHLRQQDGRVGSDRVGAGFNPTSTLPSDEEGRVVELVVSDTGVGIAPENQQRIFERSFQIGQGGRGRASGQGLGLAIVRMIVELHGGSVMVKSRPGEGSTFVCTLPCLLK
jgi:PAS domain S-box-containing protein